MAGLYAAEHASALADVSAAGAAISFVGATTVSGYAIGLGGAQQFRPGETVQTEAPKLFFVANTYGDVPPLNATCVWSGVTFVVSSDVNTVAPDGVAIATYVTLSR